LPKIIISGGGTGGHIFPALAIANHLKETVPNAEILFVGAKGKMEMEKVPKAGYKIEGLWISGIQRKLTLANLGITNRWLSSKVDKICVAYDNMNRFFPSEKLIKTGNPVRMEMVNTDGKRTEALKHFGLSSDKKTVLVVGGSLGARTLNQAMMNYAQDFESENVQVIWQTGKFYFQDTQDWAKSQNLPTIKITQFIDRMDLAYAAADVVISRAGAMSISELCLVKKPSILVPSPNVSEDHQTKNAMALVVKDAAIMIKDKDLKEQMGKQLFDLLKDDVQLKDLASNISGLAANTATEDIVQQVRDLITN